MNKKENKSIIRSELNIEKWPLFVTSNYKGKSRTLSRTVKLSDGTIHTRKVIIGLANNVEVGIFKIFDFKGFCALIKMWEEQGRPAEKNVYFSMRRIADFLNLTWGGKTNKEIKSMLLRLREIPIRWSNSFYSKENKGIERLIESFNILSDLKIFEKEQGNGQMTLAISSFRFDRRLLANLLANYSKPLLFDNILKFKKETTILLYRYIDLIMSDKNHFERNTKSLLIDLDLSHDGYPYPAQRKKLFEPVVKELEGIELSTGRISKAELIRTKDGKDWKVVFDKERSDVKNKQKHVLPKKEEISFEKTGVGDLLKELVKRGITESVSKKLIKEYPTELIKEKMSVFDVLLKGKSNLISKNPAGWLRSAIERDFMVPAGIETEEDKKRRTEVRRALEWQIEERSKIDTYLGWLKSTDKQKVYWDLESWKKANKKETGELPSHEMIAAKEKELIEKLPTNKEKQIQFFGKVLYDNKGKKIAEQDS